MSFKYDESVRRPFLMRIALLNWMPDLRNGSSQRYSERRYETIGRNPT